MGSYKNQIAFIGIISIATVAILITLSWMTMNGSLASGGEVNVITQSWDVDFTTDYNKNWNGITKIYNESNGSVVENIFNPLSITDNRTVSGTIDSLTSVGDTVTYKWYISNFGTFDANVYLTNSEITLDCYSKDERFSKEEAQMYCDNSLSKSIKIDDIVPDNKSTIRVNRGTYKEVVLTVSYDNYSKIDASGINIYIEPITLSASQV